MRSRILSVLKAAGSSYISGEAIASELGISRTAVWKHINELRQSGYHIDSHSRSGYRLQDSPDCLLPEEIKIGLDTEIMGREIIYFDDIPSTNNQAKVKARQGAVEGTVIVSEAQSIGKGRLDRSFFSPHGKGIWFSVILRPPFLPQDAPKCTLLAAVAVAAAMRSFGVEAGIKWPNDIVVNGHKITGILTEMSAEMTSIHYVVIGIPCIPHTKSVMMLCRKAYVFHSRLLCKQDPAFGVVCNRIEGFTQGFIFFPLHIITCKSLLLQSRHRINSPMNKHTEFIAHINKNSFSQSHLCR